MKIKRRSIKGRNDSPTTHVREYKGPCPIAVRTPMEQLQALRKRGHGHCAEAKRLEEESKS